MIENLVPSVELCKKLKECGFPQDTKFYWELCHNDTPAIVDDNLWSNHEYVSAPLAEEILRELPDKIFIKNHEHRLVVRKDNGSYFAGYYLLGKDV